MLGETLQCVMCETSCKTLALACTLCFGCISYGDGRAMAWRWAPKRLATRQRLLKQAA